MENLMETAEKQQRIRSVAVYLGAAETADPVYHQAVTGFARYLADHDLTLIFGGSNAGMMKLLADTMLARNGRVFGVFTKDLPETFIRHDLTGSVITADLAERKREMLRRADAAVALPGSLGTFDELFDALAQRKLGKITCPIGVLNVNGFFDPLFALLQNSMKAGFSSGKTIGLLLSGNTPEELFVEIESDMRRT